MMGKESDIIGIAAVGVAAILLYDKLRGGSSGSGSGQSGGSSGIFPAGNNLANIASDTGAQAGAVVSGIIQGYENMIKPLDDAEKNVISGISGALDKYTSFLGGLVNVEREYAANTINQISGTVKTAADLAQNTVSKVYGTVDTAAAYATNVIQGFDDVAKPVLNAGSQALQSAISANDHALGVAQSVSDSSLKAVIESSNMISEALLKISGNTAGNLLQNVQDMSKLVIPAGGSNSEFVQAITEIKADSVDKITAAVTPSAVVSAGTSPITAAISKVNDLVTAAVPESISKYYTSVYDAATNTTKMVLNTAGLAAAQASQVVKKADSYVTPLTEIAKSNVDSGQANLVVDVNSVKGTSVLNAQNITSNFEVGLNLINEMLSKNSSNSGSVSKTTYSSGWTSSGIPESKYTNVIKVK